MRLVAALTACCGATACSSSTVVITPFATSILSLSAVSARADVQSAVVVYSISFRISESSGQFGATVTNVSFAFNNGLRGSKEVAIGVFPGVANDLGPLDVLHDKTGTPLASRVTIDVSWVDTAGRPGSATGIGAVTVETIPSAGRYIPAFLYPELVTLTWIFFAATSSITCCG